MSSKIYKYPLRICGYQEMEIPLKAAFLTLQIQNGIPCMWFAVNTAAPTFTLKIHTIGTGQEFPKIFGWDKYAGTYQDGDFVWHVFFEFDKNKIDQTGE